MVRSPGPVQGCSETRPHFQPTMAWKAAGPCMAPKEASVISSRARPEEADVGQLVHHGALDEEGRDGAVIEEKDDGIFGIQRRLVMSLSGMRFAMRMPRPGAKSKPPGTGEG